MYFINNAICNFVLGHQQYVMGQEEQQQNVAGKSREWNIHSLITYCFSVMIIAAVIHFEKYFFSLLNFYGLGGICYMQYSCQTNYNEGIVILCQVMVVVCEAMTYIIS